MPAAEDLDQRVPGERLLDVAVQRAGVLPLGDELLLRALGDLLRDDHRDRHRDQRDQRQQRRDPEHHGQHADHRQQRGEQLAQGLLQGLGDVVDVVGHPADSSSPRGCPSKYGSGSRCSFASTSVRSSLHRPGDHPGQDVALHPLQQAGQDEQHHGDGEDLPQAVEVDPDPRDHACGPGHHVGQPVLPVVPQPLHGLGLGRAGR